MKKFPTVLSIAGSNNTGEAGIQSDIKTISTQGVYATTVITAIALMKKEGIKSIHSIPANIIREQIEFVMENMRPDVVKIGMIGDAESATVVADCLRKYHPKYVVYDPVLLTADDVNITDEETLRIIKDELLHFTNLMTINLPEAEVFTGIRHLTQDDIKETARILAEHHRIPILIKAANFLDSGTYDVLYIPDGDNWEFFGNKINTTNIHGASTIFSASIATHLALGEKLHVAIKTAREFIEYVINNQPVDDPMALSMLPELANSVLMRTYLNK
ncbi:hydroxymethylpyrimidine/phosphomethylpyrimidine kinase [Bacteroides sp. 519]|uniref:hydroxymethylpyrimidine/phosphomethylpyrimidine kinase n=1 Tax=Bacteroides sp. 519 TaxID=2302937 RepID=UPI0013D82B80|nr:hydroxymethylpyrimidine/phosphomethylpyrimidine kinase [Bacteroides sp. 519]NDV58519.1 hydroxymethylpyrimidine/phosphomethylpyrimidine kinase [Bacteroides sp. 519]